jgi:hypothetical protein
MAEAKTKTKADKADRIIALVEGDSGAGKSFFVGSIKNALIYDTDLGGGLAYLEERISKNGSERVELSSYRDILADLRRRAQAGTLPQSVVIDHVTQLHQEAVMRHNPTQEADFGRGGNKATYEWRQLREFIRTFDCNLFCVSHLKGKWEKGAEISKEADGAKNIEGDMHIVLKIDAHKDGQGRKKYPSQAIVLKWRRDPEDKRGPVPDSFLFTLAEFEKLHGLEYQRKRDSVELAKPKSIEDLTRVLEFLGPERSAELRSKWFSAAAVEKFEEMTEDQIQNCIKFVQNQMGGK